MSWLLMKMLRGIQALIRLRPPSPHIFPTPRHQPLRFIQASGDKPIRNLPIFGITILRDECKMRGPDDEVGSDKSPHLPTI